MNQEPVFNTELLSRLVSLPSFQRETAVSEALETILKDFGFTVEKQEVMPGRCNLLASKNTVAEEESILFYGHIDTVEPSENWHDALIPALEGDRLVGLGSYDMKGGIVAFLEATKNTTAPVKIFLAIDEENISRGAWAALQDRADFFHGVELVISAEPNFDLGLNGITRGRTGRAIFAATFTGKAAHIAKHHEGVDAIRLASEWVTQLYKQRETLFTSPKTVAQVRKIQAESVGMSVCALATLELEVLLGAEDSIENVREILRSVGGTNDSLDIVLKPRETPYLSGYFFESLPYQEAIAQIIQETTGTSMQLHDRSSVGDDNVLATLGIPVITWGPDGGLAHAAGEWVSLSSLQKLTVMYKKLLDSTLLNENTPDTVES